MSASCHVGLTSHLHVHQEGTYLHFDMGSSLFPDGSYVSRKPNDLLWAIKRLLQAYTEQKFVLDDDEGTKGRLLPLFGSRLELIGCRLRWTDRAVEEPLREKDIILNLDDLQKLRSLIEAM